MFQIRHQQFAALRKQAIGDWLIKSFEGSKQVGSRDSETGDVLVSDPSKNEIRISFDDHGFVGRVASPLGRTWCFENDTKGKLLEVQNPAGLQVRTKYDGQGRVMSISRDSRKLFDVTYDEVSRVTGIAYPDKSATRLQYTGKNLVSSVTDRNGVTEEYEYDSRGNLISLVDGNSNRTSFEYGRWNRPDKTVYPDGSSESYAYNERGRLCRISAGSRLNADLEYDDKRKPIKIMYADGEVIHFSYDDKGRVIEARNEQLVVRYQYNGEGRLLQEDQGGQTIKYLYDESGTLVGMTYPSGDKVEFHYDEDLRLASVKDWKGGIHHFNYGRDGRTTILSSPNGLKTFIRELPFGKPESIVVSKPGASGQSFFSLRYQYDQEDRVQISQDSDFGARSYNYDAESRILAVKADQAEKNEAFAYDRAGNRIACNGARATMNALNQLVSQSGTRCGYDDRGNMISHLSPEGGWKLTYNTRDLLVRAEDGRGGVFSFGYDAFGRRIWKRSGTKEVRYVWAGEQIVSELTTDGVRNQFSDYLYIPGTYTPLAMRVEGEVYCYHTDHLGTPRRMSDSQGNVVWLADYSVFGQARIKTDTVSNPLRFPGQYCDDETGFHYNRFRYYAPSLGRYLTRDPVTYLAGLNFYAYAHNDPVNSADPWGLWPSWKTVAAVAAGVAVGLLVIATAGAATPLAIVAAGVIGGAVAGGLGEALNEKTLCISCIAKAALYGAFAGAVGAAAALVAAPVLAAVGASAAFAAVGAGMVAGMAGYTAGWAVIPGAKWDWESFAGAGLMGAAFGFLGAGGEAEPAPVEAGPAEPVPVEPGAPEVEPGPGEPPEEPTTPQQDTECGEPVAVTRGEYIERREDFRLDGTIPLVAERSYRHKSTIIGALGRGRSSTFDQSLELMDGVLVYRDEKGRQVPFAVPEGNRVSRNRKYRHLAVTASGATRLTLKDRQLRKYFLRFGEGPYLLAEIKDLNGNRIRFERSREGWLRSIEHSDGYRLAFENNSNGQRRSVTLVPSGSAKPKRLVEYIYDDRANLQAAECTTTFSIRYQYDGQDRMKKWRDTSGRSVLQIFYDTAGRVVRTEAIGPYHNDVFEYDPAACRTTYRPGGTRAGETFVYDQDENIVEQTDTLGHVKRFEYEDGYRTAMIDAKGNRTGFQYDAYGNVKQIIDPEGRVTRYQWNENGALESAVDGAGNTYEFLYQEPGNLASVKDPAGGITRYEWTSAGRLARIIFPDGAEERWRWDQHNRLTELTDGAGGITRLTRDDFGRVIVVRDPLGDETVVEYSDSRGKPLDQPTLIRRPDGTIVRRSFDIEGQLSELIDGEGRRTVYRYGPLDLLLELIDPKGGSLRFFYDVRGHLERIENPKKQSYIYDRDAAGRIVAEIDFDGRRLEYSYDEADRLIEQKNADGSRLTYAYDRSGLTVAVNTFSPDVLDPYDTTRYQYDGRRLVTHAENGAASVKIDRDANGRIIAETVNGRRVASRYNARGRRIERQIGLDGERVARYTHDPRGRLKELSIGRQAPLIFDHDALGRETERTSAAGFMLQQRYDAVGQILAQVVSRTNGGTVHGLEVTRGSDRLERRYSWNRAFEPVEIYETLWGQSRYTYDANGQITERQAGGGPHPRMRVDGLLTGEVTTASERFAYDAGRDIMGSGIGGSSADDRSILRWQTSSGGKVQQAQGPSGERVTPKYDVQGREIERRVERNGFRPQIWHYSWDAYDRLVSCRTPKTGRWYYLYDPFGRRIAKRRGNVAGGQPSAGAEFEEEPQIASKGEENSEKRTVGYTYVWDRDVIAEEAPIYGDGSTGWEEGVCWHFVPGTFVPLAREQKKRLHYVVTDHLGTPRELLGEDGSLTWAVSYSTWGSIRALWQNVQDTSGAGTKEQGQQDARAFCPIRFQGQWADPETGLYYNRFRHYDPLASQYASPDPIGLRGGSVRPQGYVDNPAAWVDPLGLVNLNSNDGQSNFGIYRITIGDEVYKYGKADLTRVTESSGLPTRLHQQVRKLSEQYPDSDVQGEVINDLGETTTSNAKAVETQTIQEHYDRTGVVPEGNRKSFTPKCG